MELVNYITSRLFGEEVGCDEFGNRFYKSNKLARFLRKEKRWVYYTGLVEATKVGVDWFLWLHHRTNELPSKKQFAWIKPRKLNLTGSKFAFSPREDGEPYTKTYESWQPQTGVRS